MGERTEKREDETEDEGDRKGGEDGFQDYAEDEQCTNDDDRAKLKSPQDSLDVDHRKLEPLDPAWNEEISLEESSFSTRFAQSREKYLGDSWPLITRALKEHGISCELDLVDSRMTVSTTRKTRDPFFIFKARDLINLLSRSIPVAQAVKVLDDDMQCDIESTSSILQDKELFVNRRQRVFGLHGATSKAIELITECYMMLQERFVKCRLRLLGSNGAATLNRLWLMILLISWSVSSEAQSSSPPPAAAPLCPLDFTILNQYPGVANAVKNSANNTLQCVEYDAGLEAVIASYLKNSSYFLIPNGTSKACQTSYQSQLESQGVPSGFNISQTCKPNPLFSERGTDLCHSIQSAQDFRSLVPESQVNQLNSSCSGPLQPSSNCGVCNTAISPVVVTLNGLPGGTNMSCSDFVNIYTMAFVNTAGPTDPNTLLCLLYIAKYGGRGNSNLKFIGVGVGGMLFVCIIGALVIYYRYRRIQKADREARKKRTKDLLSASSVPTSSINWFDIDELKRATGNFNRNNILGTGGYGNVYKGILQDGSLVAVKRFKNCSPSGDKDFVHEVEMISSVKHRHLVEIRGCCVDSSSMNGHQRIIVYDYMSNGSLADHLFLKEGRPSEGGIVLSWATRKKIAVGVAKGLAYLHHDAVPAIFHRDIKSSNILLDQDWNARLADFGLAKFTPEGVSHVTTRVAGTYGYVAPEYALYGQLTEKSDVYSFGMVVLELVSGRKALAANSADPANTLLSDWAWPLVKQRRWREFVDPRMGNDIGSDEEMEGFILVGLLCAHPQVAYRPSIDQALKMLERGPFGVSVPDRPLPFTSGRAEIFEALSQESQENQDRSRRTGYSSFTLSSLSYHSSNYSGSLPASWYERKVSDKTQDMSFQSSDASASLPSLHEGRVSPDRTLERSIQSPEASLPLLEETEVSADIVQDMSMDIPASQLSTLDEETVSAYRTKVVDVEKHVSQDGARDADVEKQVSPD
ncbi:unnamed protein product [Calypogeia fissa]